MKNFIVVGLGMLVLGGVGGMERANTLEQMIGSIMIVIMAITILLLVMTSGKNYWKIPQGLMCVLGILLITISIYFLPRVQGIINMFFTGVEFITGLIIIMMSMLNKPARNRLLHRV